MVWSRKRSDLVEYQQVTHAQVVTLCAVRELVFVKTYAVSLEESFLLIADWTCMVDLRRTSSNRQNAKK